MNVKDLRPANASSSGDDASSISCDVQLSQCGKEKKRERESTYEVVVLHESYDM